MTKAASEPKSTATISSVAQVTTAKKRYFTDKRTQSIGITIAKMPAIDKIREALSSMEDTLLQKNQVSALLRGK
jgi:hypothetical protein